MIDREACILLNMISGIGHAKYLALKKAFGSESEIFKQSENLLAGVHGIGEIIARRIVEARDGEVLRNELDKAARAGVRIVTLLDADYPLALRELYDPPLCLYVRGTLPEFNTRVVSIVGSRRTSKYGERMAYMLGAAAANYGYIVVSGLALGVDGIAHRAVVENCGITVGVLGGGLMRFHPAEHIPLAGKILDSGGALISEFPLDFPVSRTSFPRRNRIVAALSQSVIVVEAGLESGAMITAGIGRDYGREIMAVPGMADNPQSQGCHRLIKDGAHLIENFDDVLQIMEGGLFSPGHRRGEEIREKSIEYDPAHISGLAEDPRTLFELLRSKGERSLEQLALELDWDTGRISGNLMILELHELVTHDASGYYGAKI